MEEIKVKSGEEYVPLSIFMQTEQYKPVPCTISNKTLYEVSNYGKIRSINTENNHRGSGQNNKNRCNILLDDGGRIRVFTGAVILNAFYGDVFSPGDMIQYIDGDDMNLRLDNLKKLRAGTDKPDGAKVNTMKSYFPEKVLKRKSEPIIDTLNIKGSKLLRNAFQSTILGMFTESGIPVPVTLLYKNMVESSKEIKDIVDIKSFISLIGANHNITSDYAQVLLKTNNSDIISSETKGYVSLRIAILLKMYYNDSFFSSCRKRYIVDKSNNAIVDFGDSTLEDSNRFLYYPAPSYIELMDYLIKTDEVYINANWSEEFQGFEGVIIYINSHSFENTEFINSDYETVIENTIVAYLIDEYENDKEDDESETDTENSIETLTDE